MDLQLNDKIIVVTGGAKGIGEGISKVLAAEGAIPVIVGRNEADNQKTVDAILATGGNAFQVMAELSIPAECGTAISKVMEKFSRIDGLVNNAGVNDGVDLEHGSYEHFMESLHKNLVHYYLVAQYALPHLIRSKGSIVNIGSKTAETGQGGTSAYAAANGGRNALTREWAVELLKYQIRVNAVMPGLMNTPLIHQQISGQYKSADEMVKARDAACPMKRMGTAWDVARAALFLASDDAAYITGVSLPVDGGLSCRAA